MFLDLTLLFFCFSKNNIVVASVMNKNVTIMADGNSGVLGVGEVDGRGEVAVGVAAGVGDGVGVGVLSTLKAAEAVATVAPLEAATAVTEIV